VEDDSLLGFARIALPLQEIDQNVSRLRGSILIATLLATLLAVVLAALIAARTTLPLIELTEAAKKISTGNMTDKLIPTTRDEVGQLTRAFNNMGAQIRSQIEALQTERIKLAAVLAEMTDGVLIVNELGEVQLINPAAEQMFSVREGEAIGHSLAGVLRHHQLVELWQQCKETGEEQDALLEISTKGIILQGLAIPLEQALPGSILLLFQDLTHLRRLETVRRDFISNISHELRTPLASLKALTETLQEGALEDPPAARRFLGRMEAEVDSLTLMVQELLELSRIESGKVPLQLTPISPCSLLSTASERLRLQAERAELKLEINCADQLPDVWADPPRMEQVIVNLLHNAIKFTSSGGEITLSAWQDRENIIFSVQDNGVGIPADDLSRIFERFFKSDRARTTGGTGLGLAISRHLVEAHAGRIWAESIEGKGSTFFFQLPIAS
jgi:two-component system phosphate regulon sensor histidine kinase PhoR